VEIGTNGAVVDGDTLGVDAGKESISWLDMKADVNANKPGVDDGEEIIFWVDVRADVDANKLGVDNGEESFFWVDLGEEVAVFEVRKRIHINGIPKGGREKLAYYRKTLWQL